jgi:hypothetical protein
MLTSQFLNATQTALDLKAPLNSPAFTGTVTGVTSRWFRKYRQYK